MDSSTTHERKPDKTRHLGPIEQPLLICGGAYSNLEALTALFEAAEGLGVPHERILHTGDAVAYCADPAATAEMLRARGVHAIQGNVEESLWASMPDCGCGFEEGTPCEKLSAEWFAYADARIGDDLRAWMGGLPYQLTFTMAGQRVRVVHGGVREINRFLFASAPDADFEAEFDDADADIVLAGHAGLPFTRRIGNRVWHNSGSLGMPANDGTPRVWFSLMIPEANGLRFEHRPLRYDHERARAKMLEAGLPDGYAQALKTGRWPSLSVLPEAERGVAGEPIEPSAFIHSRAGLRLAG